MSDIIATESYAKFIGGANITYISDLGCTKSRAIALGCEVSGNYVYNQLVCEKDLSKATKTYIFKCNVTYLSSQSTYMFFTISDNTLIGTKKYIDAFTSAYCDMTSTSPTTLNLNGNKYVNDSGTYDMESGKTYHIIYVLIEGKQSDDTKLPSGYMQDNWKSAGSFVFYSTIYNYNINLTIS